jgi:hypothetical protein
MATGCKPGTRLTVPLRCTRAPSLSTVTAVIGASRTAAPALSDRPLARAVRSCSLAAIRLSSL